MYIFSTSSSPLFRKRKLSILVLFILKVLLELTAPFSTTAAPGVVRQRALLMRVAQHLFTLAARSTSTVSRSCRRCCCCAALKKKNIMSVATTPPPSVDANVEAETISMDCKKLDLAIAADGIERDHVSIPTWRRWSWWRWGASSTYHIC